MLDLITLEVTADGSGDGDVLSSKIIGTIEAVGLVLENADSGVVVTLAAEPIAGFAAIPILTAFTPGVNNNVWLHPRVALHGVNGVALDSDVFNTKPIVSGPVRLTIAGAGNAGSVKAVIYYHRD